jgi:O-antigen ligase
VPLVIAFRSGLARQHRVLAGVAAAMMAGTIFLSGSRGGMIAFAAEIVLLAGWLIKQQKSWRTVFAFGGFLLVATGLTIWLGGGELLDRVGSIHGAGQFEVSGGTRLQIARDTVRMFAQKPVLGWGLGVFQEVYPQFRSFSTNLVVDRAHNDYLQILAETGAVGFAVVLWFLWIVLRSAAGKLRSKSSDVNVAVTLAALLGITGILVHSLVDFNLQIPANAALFYVLCGVAAMEPRFGGRRRVRHRRHYPSEDLLPEAPVAVTASTG